MRQFMLVILQFCLICCSWTLKYHGEPAPLVISECMSGSACDTISVEDMCTEKLKMNDPTCIMDISGVSQENVSKLLNKHIVFEPWIICNGSDWSEVNFSNLAIGHRVRKPFAGNKKEIAESSEKEENYLTLKDYSIPALTLVNNLNLRYVTLNQDLENFDPGLLKIRNNPRLARSSLNSIWSLVSKKKEIEDRADIQPYGECDFHTHMNPQKDSLTWEEFRWCRNVLHNVVLDGSQFNSIVDAAYVLEVQGILTISNTKLKDLRLLPVYFKINNGVISNNMDLCITFEDEIRMKRLGFIMEKNKPLDCRTICQGGKLTLEEMKSRKNCVTIQGRLELINIDESTAAADLFRTVKKIEGPLIIRNAKVPVVFKKLKSIGVRVSKEEPHLLIENCIHPIVFNQLVELEGYATSPMVVLNGGKTNLYKHLTTKYPGKVFDSVRDQSTTVTSKPVASVNLPITTKIVPPGGTTATPVAMPVAMKTKKPEGNNVANAESIKPASVERPSRLPFSTYAPPGPNAAEISDVNSSRGDVNNSSVDDKKTVLVVMTCVSFFIFLASSVTSIGIFLKYRLM